MRNILAELLSHFFSGGSNAKLLLRLANAETVPVSLGAQPEGDVSEGCLSMRVELDFLHRASLECHVRLQL